MSGGSMTEPTLPGSDVPRAKMKLMAVRMRQLLD